MGEYAEFKGQRIKIGTCENMYYLRWDQRGLVKPLIGNVNPVKDAPELRYRFPWPDEDKVAPGVFDPFERAIGIPGFNPPGDSEHGTIQFHAHAGYLVSLPCPESAAGIASGLKFARNGFGGAVQLVQQRFRPGIGLVPVFRCGGCGYKYRLEERPEIEAAAVACRVEGDARDRHERVCRDSSDRRNGSPLKWAPMPGVFWHAIADRLLAGLAVKAEIPSFEELVQGGSDGA